MNPLVVESLSKRETAGPCTALGQCGIDAPANAEQVGVGPARTRPLVGRASTPPAALRLVIRVPAAADVPVLVAHQVQTAATGFAFQGTASGIAGPPAGSRPGVDEDREPCCEPCAKGKSKCGAVKLRAVTTSSVLVKPARMVDVFVGRLRKSKGSAGGKSQRASACGRAYKSRGSMSGEDPMPICPPFPPWRPELVDPKRRFVVPPFSFDPPRPLIIDPFTPEAFDGAQGADAEATGALGRENCSIRLAAHISESRKNPAWRFERAHACDRFVQWSAHTLDLMVASHEALVPTEDGAPGTFDRIRALSPSFTGVVVGLPSAMHEADALVGADGQYDPLRDTASYLSTALDAERWALKVANWGGPYPPRPPGATDFLPYYGFEEKTGRDPLRAIDVNTAAALAMPLETKVDCVPRPLMVDPDLGGLVFAQALYDTCTRFGADALYTDDHTAVYTPPANAAKTLDRVVVYKSGSDDCAIDGPGTRVALIRQGNGLAYAAPPFTQFRPDVCGGAAATNAQRRECGLALTIARTVMLGTLNEALDRAASDSGSGEQLRMPTVWPNLYTLTGHFDDGNRIGTHAEFRETAFDGLLLRKLGGEADVLARGGWWEKFCSEWQASAVYPVANNIEQGGHASVHVAEDGRQRVIIATGAADEPREELAIYRQRLTDRSQWLASVRWTSRSADRGGTVRVDSGFTSIDELQFCLASYLLCRASVPAELLDWPPVEAGAPLPRVPGGGLRPGRISIFPRFIHPDQGKYLLCGPEIGLTYPCDFDCARGGTVDNNPPYSTHPVIVQDVLGGRFSGSGDSFMQSFLRLLLDVELGAPTGYGQRDGLFILTFEHGEAVVYPMTDGLSVTPEMLRMYEPSVRRNEGAYYMTIDPQAVDALVDGGQRAVAALRGRLPDWSLNRNQDRRVDDKELPRQALVLQRALESGLQGAGDPAERVPGTPGLCLRRVDASYPKVPLLPGMGRIIVYGDSPIGQLWRSYFPMPVPGTPRLVPGSMIALFQAIGRVGVQPQVTRTVVRRRTWRL